MLNFSRLVLLAVLGFTTQAFAWPGDDIGRRFYDQVCFYENANYSGASFCMYRGQRARNLEGFFNDKISSVSIDGRARVTLYTDAGFGGRAMTIDRDLSNIAIYDSLLIRWNDRISSVRVD